MGAMARGAGRPSWAAEPGSDRAEHGDLLRWLADGNFLFLGYREYDIVQTADGAGLRAVPGTGLGILRHAQPGKESVAARCRPRSRAGRRTRPSGWCWPRPTPGPPSTGPATWTTSRSRSSDPTAAGQRVIGEYRFLGLYTHAAHTTTASPACPVLRRKLAQVLAEAGVSRDSHDGQDLVEILEDYPREELFQISARGAHPDRAGRAAAERAQADQAVPAPGPVRAVHVLPGVPAQGPVHHRVGCGRRGSLREALHGVSRRVQRHRRATRRWPGCTWWSGPSAASPLPRVDAAALEAEAGRGGQVLGRGSRRRGDPQLGEEPGRRCWPPGWARSIPETYKADVPAADAVDDLPSTMRRSCVRARGRPRATRGGGRSSSPGRLAAGGVPDRLPDHPDRRAAPAAAHGRRGGRRAPLRVHRALARPKPFWIYDFGLARAGSTAAVASGSRSSGLVEDALDGALAGQGRGRRVQRPGPDAHLTWRAGDRAARLRQVPAAGGHRFSQRYIERVLAQNAAIARLLVRLYESRFDPRPARAAGRARARPSPRRSAASSTRWPAWTHDRILRAYLALIDATLRTNYYKQDSPGPGPARRAAPTGAQARRPARAGSARAPARVRAVRLLAPAGGGAPAVRPGGARRAALVGPARGLPHRGARPGQGAGGQERGHRPGRRQGRLRCKRLPDPADREAYQAEVLACYQTFIAGMLDVTDNIDGDRGGAAARRGPARRRRPVPGGRGGQGHRDVLRHGQRDRGPVRLLARRRVRLRRLRGLRPQEDGHHRARRLGVGEVPLRRARARTRPRTTSPRSASATCPATCSATACCCREHIRLVAAFDHRHVFIDPSPDPAASFAER